MLWLEHGAVSHGPDLAPLPAPHEPYPLVELPPLTAKGLPASVHYRPAVGVVYYTANEGFAIRQFVESISALLGAAGEEHLKGPRAVAASPSAVLRHRGRVRGGHLLVGPRKCFRKPASEKADLPARLLLWTPPAELEPPPHYSIRAAFTWVFMPATAALAIGALYTMAELNAALAAVFYDGALLSRHADGAALSRLTLADFDFLALPPRFGEGAGPATTGGRGTGALLLGAPPRGGGPRQLAFVGQHLCLRAPPRSLAGRPAIAYDPDGLLFRGPAPQCWACDAPVGGEALVVHAPRAPPAGLHREWFFSLVPPNTQLLPDEVADKGLLLCLHCWNALDAPGCLTDHMGARVSRTVIPVSQAEACAACPGYACLAPLLEGQVAPVRGVAGAFTVSVAGETAVLAGEKLGPHPALTVPELAALRLPVIAGLRLAEARS